MILPLRDLTVCSEEKHQLPFRVLEQFTVFLFCSDSRKTLDRNARSAFGLLLSLFIPPAILFSRCPSVRSNILGLWATSILNSHREVAPKT